MLRLKGSRRRAALTLRRGLAASTLVVLSSLVTATSRAAPTPSPSASPGAGEQRVTVDGVALRVAGPWSLPAFVAPHPGDADQVATSVELHPFRELSITAMPFGAKPPSEALPAPVQGGVNDTVQRLRTAHRGDADGGPAAAASSIPPMARVLDQDVAGVATTVRGHFGSAQSTTAVVVDWVAESGSRQWLVRASEEAGGRAPSAAAADLGGVRVSSEGPVNPTTVTPPAATPRPAPAPPSPSPAASATPPPAGRVAASVSEPAVTGARGALPAVTGALGALPAVTGARGTLPAVTGARGTLPASAAAVGAPSWWNGDCDAATYSAGSGGTASFRMGAVFQGLAACGPRPIYGAADVLTHFYSGSWGVYEWECVELSLRWLYQQYGVAPYPANGSQIVWNYPGSRLQQVSNGSAGQLPAPGDVLSYGSTSTNGHTSVVTAVAADAQGNGSIQVIEENAAQSGAETLAVSNWFIQANQTVSGWLHDFPHRVHLANLDGPGHGASAISINDSNIWLERNQGNASLGSPQLGASNGPFYGSVGTHTADIDGNGRASAVAVNSSNVWIERNLGNDTFGSPQLAANNGAFYGDIGTYLAALDGSGRASAAAVNSTTIWVERNLGSGTFGSPQLAANNGAFYGDVGTYLADLDGSGRASAVAVNGSNIWVERNLGSGSFGPPQLAASNGAFYGSVGTYLADLDGSGRASAVAINDSNIWVEWNLGNGTFGPPQLAASNGAFYGTVGTYLADLDGSGRASAVAVNDVNIWVERNLGNGGFGAPQQAGPTVAFYGVH